MVLYVDGAPVDAERGLAAFDDPLDLERVELLRGPQGTLYGRNALGGVVSITSRDPGPRAELGGRVSYGTDNEIHTSAAGGGPLGDQFGVRLAGGYGRSDGSLKNVTTGDDQTAAWQRIQARGKVLLHASDVLDLRLTIGGSQYEGSTDVWVPFDRRAERETVSNAPSDNTITGITGALQADWHLDQATTLTAVLGVSQAQEEVEYDADRSAGEASRVDGENTASTGSIEVRLGRRDDGPLDWLVGAFAARDRVDYQADTQFSDQNFGLPYYQLLGFPEFFLKDSTTTTDSVSLFGEGSYAFDQHWKLTLGARVGYERSDLDWNQRALAGGFVVQDTGWDGDRDDMVVLPKGALTCYIDDDRMAYGSITQGYRAGGLNTNATSAASAAIEYEAEYTWNYEVGWRSLWADRSFAVDVTGFYIDWRDPQVFTEQAPNDVILTNAEKSHVLGAEAEVRWRSDTGLGLWANGGIMQAEFDDRTGQEFSFNGAGYDQATVDYAGNRMAHIPEWTWALGASYQHASGAFIGSQVHGHSWTFVDDKNQNRADGVALLDAQIGYRADWWSITAFGRNLTDETDVEASITIPADTLIVLAETTYVRLAPARSIGVDVSAWW